MPKTSLSLAKSGMVTAGWRTRAPTREADTCMCVIASSMPEVQALRGLHHVTPRVCSPTRRVAQLPLTAPADAGDDFSGETSVCSVIE